MTSLPEPLVPAECDLQDFPFMPLHVARLRDSDLAAEASPEACWYAVLLWAASWHQLPAGSLPDNEAVLARLLGLGRDVRTFRKHKEAALRGFVKCSDGRLYHPVVAEQARTAWESKLQQRWRTECARIKKQNQRNGTEIPLPSFAQFLDGVSGPVPDPGPETVPGDTRPCPSGQAIQETGTGTGILEEEAEASVASAAPKPTKAPSEKAWERDPEFRALWEAATPEMRRRAKSMANVWPEWLKARKGTEPRLILGGMLGYLAGDPDVKRTGGPGLHLWLRTRTWELWSRGESEAAIGADWTDTHWAAALSIWQSEGKWESRLGPTPDAPGCRVPAHLLVTRDCRQVAA